MKLLLDTCVWSGAKTVLEAAGYDTVWTGDWPQDPGDEDILATARREERILVAIDKDFGELAIRRGLPHCGIVRLVDFRARDHGAVCLQVLSGHGQDLRDGAIITAQPGRLRVRQGAPGADGEV